MKVSTTVTLSKIEVLEAITTYLENNNVDVEDGKVELEFEEPLTVQITSGEDIVRPKRRRRTREQIEADKAREEARLREEENEPEVKEPTLAPEVNKPEPVSPPEPTPLGTLFTRKDLGK